ncbi:MAG: thrombospondin type 3 repeat-containing protein, partial [Candidatus Thorarchaeota archaeon]
MTIRKLLFSSHFLRITLSILLLTFFLNPLVFVYSYQFKDNREQTLEENISFTDSSDINIGVNYLFGKISALKDFYEIDGKAIKFSSTGDCFFVGTIITEFYTKSDIIIGKMNSTGDVMWIGQFNYQDRDQAADLAIDETENCLYVVGTTINNTTIQYTQVFLGCFNLTDGSELWFVEYGEIDKSEIGYAIEKIDDELFVVGLKTNYYQIVTQTNVFLANFNKTNGILNWIVINSLVTYDTIPNFVIDSNTNDIFISFNRDMLNEDDTIYSILQIYSYTGILQDEITIDIENFEINDMIINDESNNLVIIGNIWESDKQKFRDILILQLDFTGIIISQFSFGDEGFNDFGNCLALQDNSYIIFSGVKESDYQNKNIGFLTKIDLNGKVIWDGKNEFFYRSGINGIDINANGYIALVGNCQTEWDIIFKRLFLGFTIDEDADGLSRYFEEEIGTDPLNEDTDGDGFSDGEEIKHNTNPLDKNSNIKRRKFLNNFSVVLFFSVVILFVLFQVFIS